MLKALMQWAKTKSFWDKSFEYIMGIFAFIAPLISTYIIIRLLGRSKLVWVFTAINIAVVSGIPFIIDRYFSLGSYFDILILMVIYAGIFVPLITAIMRHRRSSKGFEGKWNVWQAFSHHKTIYMASMIFYVYSIFFIWELAFNLPSYYNNISFYIFTAFLTFYYMILGFGIARVGMEEKKRRKAQWEKTQNY
ncbi:MAG: hypothetical protein ACYCSO_03510 [Cuniculiplasma sp.]